MSFDSIGHELDELGLTPFFRQQFLVRLAMRVDHPRLVPGRLVCERRGEYDVATGAHTLRAALRGRLSHALSHDERPTVGDWVLVEPADPIGRVHEVLDRQTVLRRVEVDGSSRAQALAANVDLCLVVCALAPDSAGRHVHSRTLNVRRIERYLLLARESHIQALVVVNKIDLVEDAERVAGELGRELPGVDTVLASAETGHGLDALRSHLPPGTTGALLGSSGVGKSSIANRLLERSAWRTANIRFDDARGRHTTTERQLAILPGGGILIDTPGLRELAPWADAAAKVESSGFSEVDEFAARCRFGNCRHENEPGCAVRAALEAGDLSPTRLEHARKLERERLHQLERTDARRQREAKKRRRALSRSVRDHLKAKARDE